METREFAGKIQVLLETIGTSTGRGAVYHGLHDRLTLSSRRVCAFCAAALQHPVTAPLCRYSCCTATMNALSSGEPCFYRCWAGLLFVTVPVAPQQECRGGISVGGFHSAGEEDDIRQTLQQRLAPWRQADTGRFLKHLPSLRCISATELRGLGEFVLESTFSSGLNDSDFVRRQHERYVRQRRIAEAFEDIRTHAQAPPDLLAETSGLVRLLRPATRAEALAAVPTYLAGLLMAARWEAARLKAHLRVLLALITQQRLLDGASWAAATSREQRDLLRLDAASSVEECCDLVSRWVEESLGPSARDDSDGGSIGARTAAWLQAHYSEPVTLPAAARALGVSVSTLAHRFKDETRKTFRELLLEIRVAEAKRLLATTRLEINAIADACGFCDQSHFTRSLRHAINLTPGQFRRLLRVPDEQLRGG
jgi:AraC-like DNA-binding protein